MEDLVTGQICLGKQASKSFLIGNDFAGDLPSIKQVGALLADVLDAVGDEGVERRVREAVLALCRRFPVYS